ncbi:uncharacterized protein LOC116733185 [Xiphophorus hellerii]|uniref:uncharacterized protein LOC116733185 n=1 Tax=Xiphophorus hellerii TaxID=8084 RepID=UPI0013B46E08|nr:uncharacterized protein LOC116733185 [Xiphophorus hellerii]
MCHPFWVCGEVEEVLGYVGGSWSTDNNVSDFLQSLHKTESRDGPTTADRKMKVILLIAVMSSCAVGDEDFFNNQPCEPTNRKCAFENFKENHILPKNFDTSSKSAWECRIQSLSRCKMTPLTFIEESNTNRVIKICNGGGWNWEGNLCTSTSNIPVYVVKVNMTDCKILNVPMKTDELVTVACDKVGKRCLPVHLQAKQTKEREKVTCSSAAADDYWSDEQFNISIRIG